MKKVILTIITLLLICCGDVKATNNNVVNRVIKPLDNKTVPTVVFKDPIEVNLDDMTFESAFSIQYRAKGEGHTFWWKDQEYTTNLVEVLDEFVLRHVTHDTDNMGWVLNDDDPDDNCRSNKLDDCGVCDGPGRLTWFRDKDRDGLGTFTEWLTSCTYPTDVEIEKYQVESLHEGGGDQGIMKD